MVTLSETRIENRYRVQPNHANNYESLHGGTLMKWMDEVGAMAAMRFAGESCVTAGVTELDFQQPVPIGAIARIGAYAYETGRTSVRVRIRAWREDPRTGETAHTTEASFTFVAVDGDGSPVEMPELTAETDEERELRTAARDAES
ncbi:acyl-CoA thioesterase [Halalkalicoccus jeotgali]|uniref:Thioesterase superfamily protein n=1 Tax=Halalkalicoccus jeotgali (strain DSM 18796 / CECT 7217 / JCM 14584 / KCTC 4019 / B3) TaxID=795797 RepID=D8J611_HALJB|nr:acyl-CoA thioesterase [Halalkalicoccus jeotgali]ADJ13817.1 thioesterase superfamily protein [Halalkalicoccus jeotgali B3]ELY34137.1 thioesterase superfamily protein [Halalkalicoccus jeotgali B3]